MKTKIPAAKSPVRVIVVPPPVGQSTVDEPSSVHPETALNTGTFG
jgi:hypothetical protein